MSDEDLPVPTLTKEQCDRIAEQLWQTLRQRERDMLKLWLTLTGKKQEQK